MAVGPYVTRATQMVDGGLALPAYDYVSNTYTGTNLTQSVYKRGGASGTTVATATMTYDGNDNLLTLTLE